MKRFKTAIAGIAISASTAFGQTANWTGPTTGNYNTAANWSGGVVPNGGTLTAVINPLSATTVALNSDPFLRNLTVGAGHRLNATDHYIEFEGASNTINNAGTITLFGDTSGASLFWDNATDVTLTGGGTIILNFGDIGGIGGTFTNANNTIRGGDGFLYFENETFVNNGLVSQEAGLIGLQMTTRPGANGIINTGTIQTTAGTMNLSGAEARSILNTGGALGAHGTATLALGNNLLITGGTLQTSGNGLLTVTNNLRLDGVSIGGRLRVRPSDIVTFSGSATHTGTIALEGTVDLGSGTATWNGNGTVAFGAATPFIIPAIVTTTGTLISSNNFIGSGTLSGFALRTSGLISNQGGLTFTTLRTGAGGMVHTGTILAATNSGALYFDGNSSTFDLNSATVIIAAGSGSISRGQLIVDDTAVVNANTISLGGELGFAGNGIMNVTKLRDSATGSAAGILRFYNGAGRLNIRAGGGTLGTSRFGSMSFSTATTGVFDITDHAVILDSATAASVSFPRSRIVTSFNAGAWNGPGITSSLAATAALTSTKTAVGYVRANNIFTSFPATFHGQPVVNSSAILMLYTLSGDANLDRVVNITDFARLAAKFNQPADWIDGDFNFDGTTNISDFAALAANFNKTLAGDLPRDVPRSTSVPEPGSLVLVGIAAALKCHRRRRNGPTSPAAVNIGAAPTVP